LRARFPRFFAATNITRNALADRLRASREHVAIPEDLAAPAIEPAPAVDELSQCLPRVLADLSPADRLAITLCDLGGGSQRQLADQLGISLSGAKSRIQRARRRLRDALTTGCRVRFDDDGRVCGFTPRAPL
jgi:RNA polymerase sigma-70 factor (ECF subfamily)